MDGAARVLETLARRAASSSLIERDLRQLRAMEPEDVGDCAQGLSEVRRTPHLRATFGLGLGLMALQQFSGVNTIMYYGAAILIMCGFEEKDSVALTAVLALAQGLGIVVSLPLWERCGRRRFLNPVGPGRGGGDGVRRPGFLGGYRHVQVRRPSRRRHLPRASASGCRAAPGSSTRRSPDAPAGPRPGGGVHGELDRELRGGGDVFVAVHGAGPRRRASQLYIVVRAAWLHGALPGGRPVLEDGDLFRARSYGQVRTAGRTRCLGCATRPRGALNL